MHKYFHYIIYLLIIILPKTTMANNNAIYNFAGILPIIFDHNNQAWVYFGVEYVNNEKRLAILAGKKDNKDNDSLQTAIRELNEESLDVFTKYININKLNNESKQLDYNILFLLSTKLYIMTINANLNSQKCDQFIKLYNERRYHHPQNYKRLHLAQRETYELRKVELKHLLEFLESPENFEHKITSYGGKNCQTSNDIPLRWSSKILLKNQIKLKNIL